jgi:hypothetical protein
MWVDQGLQTHGTECAQYACHPWCKYIRCCITRTATYLTNELFPGGLTVADFMTHSSLRSTQALRISSLVLLRRNGQIQS